MENDFGGWTGRAIQIKRVKWRFRHAPACVGAPYRPDVRASLERRIERTAEIRTGVRDPRRTHDGDVKTIDVLEGLAPVQQDLKVHNTDPNALGIAGGVAHIPQVGLVRRNAGLRAVARRETGTLRPCTMTQLRSEI